MRGEETQVAKRRRGEDKQGEGEEMGGDKREKGGGDRTHKGSRSEGEET